jgi:hypothetical protein
MIGRNWGEKDGLGTTTIWAQRVGVGFHVCKCNCRLRTTKHDTGKRERKREREGEKLIDNQVDD